MSKTTTSWNYSLFDRTAVTLGPKMRAPAGDWPDRRSMEEVMRKHRNLLPRIMLILRIRVKIIIKRR